MSGIAIDPAGLQQRASRLDAIAVDLDWTRSGIAAALELIGAGSPSVDALRAVVAEMDERAADLRSRAEFVESLHLDMPATAAGWVTGVLDVVAVVDTLTHVGGDADQWGRLFDRLSAAERTRIVTARPSVIGSHPQAPLSMRVAANRLLVAAEIERVAAELDDIEGGWWAGARDGFGWVPGYDSPSERREALTEELADLRYLLDQKVVAFSWDGAGSVATWHGRLEAPDVVVYLPGTGHSKSTIQGLDDRSQTMVALAPDDLAAVTAMIYDAPDTIPEAGLARYAGRAVPGIIDFVDGLPDDRHLTLLGHSYGSTALGAALVGGLADRLADDTDVIIIGSPGVGVDQAEDLGVPPEHVWVGLLAGDEIRLTGSVNDALCARQIASNPLWASCEFQDDYHHGANPAHIDFGARVFATELGSEGGGLVHGRYWDPASITLANMVLIALGDYEGVTFP